MYVFNFCRQITCQNMSKMFTIILGQTKECCGSDYTEKKKGSVGLVQSICPTPFL